MQLVQELYVNMEFSVLQQLEMITVFLVKKSFFVAELIFG